MLAPPALRAVHPLGKSSVLARPIASAIVRNVKTTFIEPNLRRQLDSMEAELAHAPWFKLG